MSNHPAQDGAVVASLGFAGPLRWLNPRRYAGPLGWLAKHPSVVARVAVMAAFAAAIAILLRWTHAHPLLGEGQVAVETRLVRVPFEMPDLGATGDARQMARLKAPRVYVADVQVLDRLRAEIERLPEALQNAPAPDQVARDIAEPFGLTADRLAALRAEAQDPAALAAWKARAAQLDELLRAEPILDAPTYQHEKLDLNQSIDLKVGELYRSGLPEETPVHSVAPPEAFLRAMRALVARAGFAGAGFEVVVARLTHAPRPTFAFDPVATDARRAESEAAVVPRMVSFVPGQVLVARGERVAGDRLDRLRAEAAAYRATAPRWQILAGDAALLGAALLASLGLAAYVLTYSPAIPRSARRLAAVAGLLTLCLAFACWVGAAQPDLTAAATTIAVVAAAMILAVAYDRKTALGLGSLLALLCTVALQQPAAFCAAGLCAVGVVAWRLREARTRNSLVFAGLWGGAAAGLSTLLVGALARPPVEAAVWQVLSEAGTAAAGAVLVGFIVLGTLPLIERCFGVTTAMTLIELRDPKHPLLRSLQQQAPGTYNHSLNVASLAEAAADAIGADSLRAYVGALYHDVGKMNKPEYFVENQVGTLNRHEKLTPAMSLLVIVGHVRDGVELAREHRLPGELVHFIEAHHGTTLVEYFFHRAKRLAEAGAALAAAAGAGAGPTMPQELEYRYPGPKPRTKEVAIVMLCDAAESATRSLIEPSASRIDSLVRAIAHKRLMDGQFDDSDLTLRDLSAVIDSVTRTLTSIYHARIAYPDSPPPPAAAPAPPAPPATPRSAPVAVAPAAQAVEPRTPATSRAG